MNNCKKLCLSILTLVSFFSVLHAHAWNWTGHRVIAEVAYMHLTPEAREKVDELTTILSEMDHRVRTFSDLNVWPDLLRGKQYKTFSHWHYIDFPMSMDHTPLKNTVNANNALRALKTIQPILQNARANPSEQAEMLAFFAHIIGDLHQPLHTVSLISADFPDGDRGGNNYQIEFSKSQRRFFGVHNLHQLWDRGVGLLPQGNKRNIAYRIAMELTREYPLASMEQSSRDLDPVHWTREGMQLAKSFVYTTPLYQTPSAYYMHEGQEIAKKRLVLAGYRLAVWLNQVYGSRR